MTTPAVAPATSSGQLIASQTLRPGMTSSTPGPGGISNRALIAISDRALRARLPMPVPTPSRGPSQSSLA
jgi:hypothetical protein